MSTNILDLTNQTMNMTKRVNEIALQFRREYIRFIDDLSRKYGDNTFWCITPLATKNSLIDNSFYRICVLKYVLEEIECNKIDEVILSDSVLQKIIKQNCQKDISIKFKKSVSLKTSIKENKIIRDLYAKNKVISRIRTIREFSGAPEKKIDLEKRYILFCTYRILSQYSDGVYKERYFPGLVENSPYNILFFSQCEFNDRSEGEQLGRHISKDPLTISFEQFVLDEDFSEVDKYQKWCNGFIPQKETFLSIEVSSLIKDTIRRGAYEFNALYSLVKGKAVNRLLDRFKNIKAVYDWYEGQSSSISMFKAIRSVKPDISTVAYIQAPLYETNLSYYPSDYQQETKVVPEFFALQGSAWRESFIHLSANCKYMIAPSFRYNHIFNYDMRVNDKGKDILLVLSFSKESSTQMLKAFFEAIKDEDIDSSILIKNHPLNLNMKLTDYGLDEELQNQHNVRFVTGSMEECVNTAQIVFVTESTAVMEIEQMGVYTVSFVPKAKLQATGYPVERYQPQIVYGVEDIKQHMLKVKSFKIDTEMLKKMRNDSFTKVTKDTVSTFLSF